MTEIIKGKYKVNKKILKKFQEYLKDYTLTTKLHVVECCNFKDIIRISLAGKLKDLKEPIYSKFDFFHVDETWNDFNFLRFIIDIDENLNKIKLLDTSYYNIYEPSEYDIKTWIDSNEQLNMNFKEKHLYSHSNLNEFLKSMEKETINMLEYSRILAKIVVDKDVVNTRQKIADLALQRNDLIDKAVKSILKEIKLNKDFI